ncbi:MAG: ribosome maturation factor RimP [Clostridiales bacterium]|nr:ribosome maturation factor RimP [Clostridiales bacterium]MCD7872578.1 ribosome maturation factor RimP [Clostridiales bacterium]
MAGKNTVEKVLEIAEPLAAELGLEIWDVTFKKEGADWYLRIFIDKKGGVTVDDCVDLTHAVAKPLDEADPISQSYMLEICSPGIERELKKDSHFVKYIGSPVMLRTIRPVNNARDFAGTLEKYENGLITVLLKDGEILSVLKKDISYIKLDDFDINDFNKEIQKG